MGEEVARRIDAAGPGAESWLRVSEGLISGIHHALNNRMAALRAVGQVMETDLPADHPLAGALASELDRLERTAELLSLLGRSEPNFEPIQVESLLEDARRLFEMHQSLRDHVLKTEVSPDLLPVLGNPAGLLRGVLLMLASAIREGATEVALHADGDERVVRISVWTTATGDETGNEPDLQGIGYPGMEQVLELAGASLELVGEPKRLQATILTLPEARRMEKR